MLIKVCAFGGKKERNRCCSQGDLSGAHSCTALTPEDEQAAATHRPHRLTGAGSCSPRNLTLEVKARKKCWVTPEQQLHA